ncbi:MAG TPA: TetR/AcrR family transcriptional regulator [Chloroflexota bacterium]|jgi:AcrR family transcriptional regulator|nr:TetR/AcrR family transcriptional regulator [Chloroflexota bacterium]
MRERILDAAVIVLRERGETGATTREIARVAGCSEGSLYTHFANKEALLLAVMTERLPPFIPVLKALLERAGEDTLQDHLEEVARIAVPFYLELTPMVATVIATPGLSESLRRQGLGPHRANQALATYLRLEQRLGRLRAGASPEAATALLLGACQQRAMQLQFLGQAPDAAADERFVADLVSTLVQGLQPEH